MGTLASLAIALTANTASFELGMRAAKLSLDGFEHKAHETEGTWKHMLEALGAAEVAHEVYEFVKSSFEAVSATAVLADKLGSTTEELTRLQYAAQLSDVSNEALIAGFQKLEATLGQVAAGEGKTAAKVLQGLGLEVKDLAKQNPVAAFQEIAEAISKVQNPFERAAAARALFGKGGQELLPLLRDADKMRELADEADRFGATIGSVDAIKVKEAEDSFKRLELVIKAVGNKLAIELAPYIQVAADKMVALTQAGGGLGPIVSNAVGMVVTAAAKLADFIEVLKVGFYGVKTVVLGMATASVAAIFNLVWAMEKVHLVSKGTSDTLRAVMVDLGKQTAEAAQQVKDSAQKVWEGTNSKNAEAFLADLRAKAEAAARAIADARSAGNGGADIADAGTADAIDKIIAKLEEEAAAAGKAKGALELYKLEQLGASAAVMDHARELAQLIEAGKNQEAADNLVAKLQAEVEAFGLSSREAELYKLKIGGVSEETLRLVRALTDQIEEMDRQKKMTEEAARIHEQVRTPLEKYNMALYQLGELLDEGKLSWEDYQRAVRKAQEELHGKGPGEAKVIDLKYIDPFGSLKGKGSGGNASADHAKGQRDKMITALERMEKHTGRLAGQGLGLQ